MRRTPIVVIALVIVALAMAGCDGEGDASTPSGTAPDEIAPIFAVETDAGMFALSDHIATDGRPVFLNLWASWCYPCREEMPAIDEAAARHPEVAFIGIAVQDPSRADAEAFADEIGVSYPLGYDEDGSIDDAYKPVGLPASFIISGDGLIVERIFGKVTADDLDEKFAEHFG